MTKAKRYVSFLLTITLLLSMIPMRVSAETAASAQAPAPDRIQAECQITTAWGEYYSGIITLKNISNQTIENWKISGICADEIDYIYDAQIMEHTGTSYIIKNNNWNANIAPGETVSFGFNAKIDKNAIIDETMQVDKGLFDIQLIDNHSAPVTVPDAFEVIFTVTSDWGTGYNASFEVRNHTDKVMENWRLEFDFDRNINSIWNASIIAHEGNHYIIQNDGWNANIPANGSVTFGCAGSPGNLSVKPDNYILLDEGEEGNEDDGKDITCQLMIDTSAFIPVEAEGRAFYTDQKIGALAGTLSDPQNVTTITLTIKCGNLELVNTSITPAVSWSYTKPNLPKAIYNQITVTAVMKNGKTVEESISLIQFSEENFDESLLDTSDDDGDGLLNWLEDVFGTDRNNPDTDGDGLTDYEEIFITFTDPLLWDTDGTGISDGEQDFDNDGLNNIQECFYGTNPYNPDTDGDGLSDNDEIFVYFTDSLKADTDDDGLPDALEIKYGMNPNNPDTLGDGVLDGNRIFTAEKASPDWDEEDLVKPILEIDLQGNQIESLTIEKVEDTDVFLNPDIPGYIGSAYDFHVDGSFETATLTYEFDEALLKDPDFIPAIYYWNEEIQLLEELSGQTITGNTVSVKLEHFSSYILLNKNTYENTFDPGIRLPNAELLKRSFDVMLVIDESNSMENWTPSNDPKRLRVDAAKHFTTALLTGDRAGVIGFSSTARLILPLSDDMDRVRTSIDQIRGNFNDTFIHLGLKAALSELITKQSGNRERIIVLLTDGEDSMVVSLSVYEDIIRTANNNDIKIYTIGLGESVNTALLEKLSSETGGSYFHASNANKLMDIFDDIAEESLLTDTDEDGVPDYYEKLINEGRLTLGNGALIRGLNGEKLSWDDPNNKDSDGDGLTDGEEIRIMVATRSDGRLAAYAWMLSNPLREDSDGDGYSDYDEIKKHHKNALVSNVKVTKLKNPDFLDIVEEVKDTNGNVISKHYYGGRQGWWEGSNDPAYKGGCGVVAAANTMAYMSLFDSKYKALYPENATLDKNDFFNYMTNLLDYVKAPIGSIAWGLTANQVNNGVVRYAQKCSIDVYLVTSPKSFTVENVTDYIKSGLKKDKPVIMLNDYNATLKNKKIPYYFLDGTIKEMTFDHHFVTITEIAEDNITGTVVVKVSTWGAYAYIDVQDFVDGWLSDVAYFE